MSHQRWITPQGIPRGLLRLYVLRLLSYRAHTGYSVMQTIEQKTEGAWRPGPGTIYPLMKRLLRERLVRRAETSRMGERTAYVITEKGKETLKELQPTLAAAARKMQGVRRALADILTPATFTRVFLEGQRVHFEVLHQMLAQLPKTDRTAALRELRTGLGTELEWIERSLAVKVIEVR